MVSPERLAQLQTAWVGLLDHEGVSPADAYPVFDRLVAAYSEPHRHYHTLEHIAEVLKVAGRLAKTSADPIAVALAVWFHDAIYDPRAKDNEERSTTLATGELTALGVKSAARVAGLVRATDHRAATPPDRDAAVLLDADLAVLAAPQARYDRYAAGIRAEYAHVPDDHYRAGRTAVLEAFLARPRIYHTELMFAEAEPAARQNLAAEIARLR